MDEVVGVDEVLREHESAGSRFTADGIDSFDLREGASEPVVLTRSSSAACPIPVRCSPGSLSACPVR